MGKQSKARPSPDNPRARLQAVEGQIDLLLGTVDVAEIVVEVRGELYMGPPKTRAGRRIVTLPRSVVEELAEHLGPVGEADGWVFTADKGGVLRPSNFRVKVWLPAIRVAGLAPLRPHDLRHTAVALWIVAGANPKEVSVRAGRPGAARRGPSAAHGKASNEEDPASYRAWAGLIGVRRQGLEPRTVALRESDGRSRDLRRGVGRHHLPGSLLAETIRC
jgi:hypothetical protein